MNLTVLSLPLLTKELIEQAQSKRTYVLRVVYAVVLYGFALFQYSGIGRAGGSSGLMNFGRGHELFGQLVAIQGAMIFLLLPAITSGALTVEKEKDTLALLLLTKLKPWTIILEKYFSRILAMGTYQLLSLPLFAIIYGMGGVELSEVMRAIATLITVTLFVGAISILCSTWFRTTSTAFVMTYVAVVFCSLFMAWQLRTLFSGFLPPASMAPSFGASARGLPVSPWAVFLSSLVSIPVLGSIFCLAIAINALIPRAFVRPRNLVLELFQKADQFFNQLNEVTTGGIILVNDSVNFPESLPIAWRETQKKSLGTFRYQFRVLMFLLTPLIYSISLQLQDPVRDFSSSFQQYPAFFWIISAVCLIIHSTGAIPSERVRQTLDVLLVLPYSSESIVKQKLSGIHRLIFVLSIPFVVLIITQAIWVGYVAAGSSSAVMIGYWIKTVTTALCVVFYMPVIMWIGFQLGLRLQTQMQAVITTCAAVGALFILPPVISSVGDFLLQSSSDSGGHTALAILGIALHEVQILSPLKMISHQLTDETYVTISRPDQMNWREGLYGTIVKIVIHFTFYGVLWWALRRNAFRSFSRIVRRMEPSGSGKVDQILAAPPG